ncbi:MAG: PIN domain-containing protein [Chitinophagaceae bacterium]|nr:PIN domain-containing protein [Chitinophagaceae bacterium]
MKNIFLDTNVLIDFLADRKPFSDQAGILFSNAKAGNLKLHISAVSYNNIYYILRQTLSHSETLKLLIALSDLVEIADVTRMVITKALRTSFFKDFEDAIQYNCALTVSNLSCMVTRDTKDYKKSSLPVMTPAEAASLFA